MFCQHVRDEIRQQPPVPAWHRNVWRCCLPTRALPRQLGIPTALGPSHPKPSSTWRIRFMRKLAYLVGFFLLATLPAVAQEEGGSKDVSIEYSYLRANSSTTGFPSFNS